MLSDAFTFDLTRGYNEVPLTSFFISWVNVIKTTYYK